MQEGGGDAVGVRLHAQPRSVEIARKDQRRVAFGRQIAGGEFFPLTVAIGILLDGETQRGIAVIHKVQTALLVATDEDGIARRVRFHRIFHPHAAACFCGAPGW